MANIFKTTDSGGLVGMLRDFALAIRQFFGTKSEMDVVATALTDLDNRKIEASDIPASLPANGGNADTVDGEHASAFAHIGAHNNLTASGNEFTFASSGFSGCIWFNYRTAGGANGNITEYKFGNGKGGELGTAIHSGNYNSYVPKLDGTGAIGTWGINISGNAATATNVDWGGVTNRPSSFTPSAHTHTTSEITNFPTSLPANGGNADTVDGYHAADFVLKTTHDEHESVIAEALSDLDSRKVDIEDIPTSLPASDVYAWAKAANKPSYSFSEITPGVATIGDGANRMMFRTNASYKSGMYYSTLGNEGMVFANINPVTSWIFANTDPTANTDWSTLTPSLQIKNGRVTINKLIKSGTNASYNLDVDGSANATELCENGVRVSVSGHTHTKSEIIDFPNFIQNITIGNVITGSPGTDAIVDASGTGSDVVLNFTIPRGDKGEQGDMKELDDEGSDSCQVELVWVYHNPNLSATFAGKIQVPLPSISAMVMDADCIKQKNEITLFIDENIPYKWKELHWLLRCSNTDCIVYTTKYATPDASFPSVSEATPDSPPTIIEISVSYNKDKDFRYVQVTVENMYGRAYYILKQPKQ